MARPFSALREKMSPESRARAEVQMKKLLADIRKRQRMRQKPERKNPH